jgi:two-component system sensor histidine kinase UhpB
MKPKKTYSLVICLVSFISLIHAQDQRVLDSLQNLLKLAKMIETSYKTLLAISLSVALSIPLLAQQAQEIDSLRNALMSAKDGILKSRIYDKLCDKLIVSGDYKMALQYSNEAKEFSAKLISTTSDFMKLKVLKAVYISSFNHIGIIYKQTGNYPEALKVYFAGLDAEKDAGNEEGMAVFYNNIATIYNRQANYSEALKNYLAALKIVEGIGNKKSMASCYNNIGIIYGQQGNEQDALKYYNASLKIKKEIGDKQGMGNTFENIGQVYYTQCNYTDALENFNTSLSVRQGIGDKDGIGKSYEKIGSTYYAQKNYTEALKIHLSSLAIREEIGDKYGIAFSLKNIGMDYCGLGDYSEAIEYLNKGLAMALEIGAGLAVKESYKELSHTYEMMNDYKNALQYYELFFQANDSLFNETKSKQLTDMQAKYESEKKEKEIELLSKDKDIQNLKLEEQKSMLLQQNLQAEQKESEIKILKQNKDIQLLELEKNEADLNHQKLQTEAKEKVVALLNKDKELQNAEIKKQKVLKYSFIGGLALFSLLSVFVFNNFRVSNKLRLQRIRNRIADDLHDDIGSTLNSISVYSEVAKQKSPAVVQELDQIGLASRKIIDAMSDIVWTINTNNDSFEQIILRLRSLTFNLLRAKNIEHTFKADESLYHLKLSMEERRNFYLIFKEALNNLVKYAEASEVTISLTLVNNFITLTIHDNGTGFDSKITYPGNGLLSMKTRAQEMNATLSIDSAVGQGTDILLKWKA